MCAMVMTGRIPDQLVAMNTAGAVLRETGDQPKRLPAVGRRKRPFGVGEALHVQAQACSLLGGAFCN